MGLQGFALRAMDFKTIWISQGGDFKEGNGCAPTQLGPEVFREEMMF